MERSRGPGKRNYYVKGMEVTRGVRRWESKYEDVVREVGYPI